MRELDSNEIKQVNGGADVGGGGSVQACTSYLWYFFTGMICCSGHCYQY